MITLAIGRLTSEASRASRFYKFLYGQIGGLSDTLAAVK